MPKPNCSKLKEYLHNLSAHSISILFASENINKASSMMGHPFLKISGQNKYKEVNHAFTYFGNYKNQNIFKFYLKSFTSGVKGTYLLEPYKNKLDFYNNKEQRSVWEFQINANKEQIEKLILHIWELNNIDSEYHFVSYNCVTALVRLLQIANINIGTSDRKFTSPIELVQNIYNLESINDISIYPAYAYKFRMISHSLSHKDKKQIINIIKNPNKINSITNKTKQEQANLLYSTKVALIAKALNSNQEKQKKYNKNIDIINSKLVTLPKHNIAYDIKNPILSDKTSSIKISYGLEDEEKVTNFTFYPVYNDFINDNSEYFSEFQLQLLNIKTKYYQKSNKFRLDNIDIVKTKNILNHNKVIGGWSKGFRLNIERETETVEETKLYPNLEVNFGKAKNLFSDKILGYFLLNPSFAYYKDESNPYIYLESGLFLRNLGKLKTYINYRKYFSDKSYKYKNIFTAQQIFFVKKNHNIALKFKQIEDNINKQDNILLEYQYNF